jgi:hypothetical protein
MDEPREIPDWVREQIDAVDIVKGAPLLAVDADEVMVVFAEHLGRYFETIGWRLDLSEYKIDGAIKELATGRSADRLEGWGLIERFFRDETLRQEAIAGAAEGLRSIAGNMQVVVLTNAPRFAREDRKTNLAGLGMEYPLIVNEGGKGRVLNELRTRAQAPVAFIDDTPSQIESAAKHAPEVRRVHFVGSEYVRRVAPKSTHGHHHPESWDEIAELLTGR